MAGLSIPVFSGIAFTLSLALGCHAVTLEEIRTTNGRGLMSRDLSKRDLSALDLRSTETFLWGANQNSDLFLGNLTIEMPRDMENILNMEKFDGMLTAIHCTPTGMSLTFEDDASFAHAQSVWDWVNGAEDNEFLMVAGRGDCAPDSIRTPYLVHSIAYDEAGNTAHLVATEGTFQQFAHTYELQVGSVPIEHNAHLVRRDFSKDASVNLDHDLQFSQDITIGEVSGTLNCNPCFTTGKLNMELNVKTKFLIPTGLEFKAAPEGVSARAQVELTLSSSFVEAQSDSFSIAEIPLAGINIPGGVLTLGPVLDVSLGYELSELEGTFTARSGATLTIPDSSNLEVNVLDPGKNSFEGWVPEVDTDPIEVEYRLSTTLQVFMAPSVKLQAEALGQGLEAGIELRMPIVEATVEGVVNPGGGACEAGDEFEAGVSVTPSIGFDLRFTAGKTGDDDFVDVELASGSTPLGGPLCFGFDALSGGEQEAAADNAGSGQGGASVDASNGGASDNDDASDAIANAPECTVDTTGISGICVDTEVCASGGSSTVSTPGFCPGPENIQCCTLSS